MKTRQKGYSPPEIEIVSFDSRDVIATSAGIAEESADNWRSDVFDVLGK